ncbi:MAG: alpha-E domain-containing protein [Betaproteobacteria bacterium]
MLSRTADHLFWMARYTERADNRACAIAAQANVSKANVKGGKPGRSQNTAGGVCCALECQGNSPC